jgi:predicted PurR-regulated permease PerM
VLGIFGLAYVAGWALKWLAAVVLLFVLSALLAFILRPLVAWGERRLGLSRTRAALLAYSLVVVGVAIAGAWAVSLLVAQVTAAITNLPAAYQALEEHLPDLERRAAALGVSVDVRALQSRLLADLQGSGLASQGLAWVAALGDAALDFFLVLFLSFYLSVDGEHLATAALRLAPARWKPHVLFVQKTLLQVVGGYLRGQLTLGAIVGASVFLTCLVLGVRYSLMLGVAGFFLEMIPMAGPFLIGAAMIGVALIDSVRLALVALAFYVALQLVESNVLGPRITGHAVGLHPIASMLGLVAGGKLFGLWGALFAVPVLGFAFVIVAAVYHQALGEDPVAVLGARRSGAPLAAGHWSAWRRRGSTHRSGPESTRDGSDG